jgi:hypothetical protein
MQNFKNWVLSGIVALGLSVFGGSTASAYTIDIQGGDISPQAVSNVLVLTNTVTTTAAESFNAWQWSIACTGCVIIDWTWNEFVPGIMNWNNQVFGAPIGPIPSIPAGGTANINTLGGFGSSWSGASTFAVGTVTVQVTATTGSVTPYLANVGEGFSQGGVVAAPSGLTGVTWSAVPEPVTTLLLGLGVATLGLTVRRSRKGAGT